MENNYGKSLSLDLIDCGPSMFTRSKIKRFLEELCDLIEMEREDLYFWDYHDDPEGYRKAPAHLKGTSAVQFISTSTIVIHTLDQLCRVFIDLFSCKGFDPDKVAQFAARYFKGKVDAQHSFTRG